MSEKEAVVGRGGGGRAGGLDDCFNVKNASFRLVAVGVDGVFFENSTHF